MNQAWSFLHKLLLCALSLAVVFQLHQGLSEAIGLDMSSPSAASAAAHNRANDHAARDHHSDHRRASAAEGEPERVEERDASERSLEAPPQRRSCPLHFASLRPSEHVALQRGRAPPQPLVSSDTPPPPTRWSTSGLFLRGPPSQGS